MIVVVSVQHLCFALGPLPERPGPVISGNLDLVKLDKSQTSSRLNQDLPHVWLGPTVHGCIVRSAAQRAGVFTTTTLLQERIEIGHSRAGNDPAKTAFELGNVLAAVGTAQAQEWPKAKLINRLP